MTGVIDPLIPVVIWIRGTECYSIVSARGEEELWLGTAYSIGPCDVDIRSVRGYNRILCSERSDIQL